MLEKKSSRVFLMAANEERVRAAMEKVEELKDTEQISEEIYLVLCDSLKLKYAEGKPADEVEKTALTTKTTTSVP